MEADAKYTYVGLAVIALLAALVGGIVWLNHSGGRQDFNYYTIYFVKQRLDGLQIGADVLMRGIKIGRVEDYQLSNDDINRVRVDIRTDRRTPVSTNTVAVVTRNFVTGLAKIDLVTPNPPGPSLESPGRHNEHAVIPEGTSNVDQIASRLNMVGDSAMETLDRLNEVLNPENRKAIDQTLANLRDLSASLNKRVAELDQTLTAVNRAADEIGNAGNRITAFVDGTHRELQPALQQAERTLRDMSSAVKTLEQQAAQTAQQVGGTVQASGDQLMATAAELRATSETLGRVLERLQDPRAALLGPDKEQRGPGE